MSQALNKAIKAKTFLSILIGCLIYLSSCTLPQQRLSDAELTEIFTNAQTLASKNDDSSSNSNSRRDRDRDDNICDERESCEDTCDMMFRKTSARSECYELRFADVDDLQSVFDVLADKRVEKRELDDIDVGSLDLFFKTGGVAAWTDIITGENEERKGENEEDRRYTEPEVRDALEWIAEEGDVADLILRDDDDAPKLMYTLFSYLGQDFEDGDGEGDDIITASFDVTDDTKVVWRESSDNISILKLSSTSIPVDVDEDDLPDWFAFVMGFIGVQLPTGTPPSTAQFHFGRAITGTFIQTAEDNSDALKLAHTAATYFCEEGVNNVSRCLRALYCSMRKPLMLRDDNVIKQVGSITSSRDDLQILDDERIYRENDCSYEGFSEN